MSMSHAIAAKAPAAPRLVRAPGYWGMVGLRLRRDPVTLVFAALLLAIVLAAVFAPLIAPFDPFKEATGFA